MSTGMSNDSRNDSRTDPPLSRTGDFPPEVLRLFDSYVHNLIDRRTFLAEAAPHVPAGRTAEELLVALSPRFAAARQVPETDPRLDTAYLVFESPQGYGRGRGYRVRPAAQPTAPRPVVLVVHENRGLNPHIEDVARRLALAGYVAFAPDALFPLGGYPGDEDQGRARFATLDQEKTRADMLAAAAFARALPESNGALGIVGFCWGGSITNFLATRLPELRAAVPFYGGAPPAENVPQIRAALLIHHAETDERINAAWPGYEAALKQAGVAYERFQYPGTQHGFHNDTTPRYDEAAAKLSWERTLAVFRETLHA
jgi:carboxymethylenebutenolidase